MLSHLKLMQTKLIATPILLVLLVACSEKTTQEGPPAAKPNLSAEAFKVVPVPFSDQVTTTADLLPNEQVSLMAPISGQVLDIYFKEGEKVKKGDKIIHIYDRNWQAEIIGLKAQLESKQKDLERKKALLNVGGSTQEEIDQLYAAAETLKANIQQLQLNVELANVKAPFSGVLGMRNFSEGAFLKEGEEITTLTELKQLKVDFSLPQEYLSSIKIKSSVRLLIEKDTLSATIYAINPLINSESRTINVRALLKQPSHKTIIPGSFAEVLISTNYIDDALLVPTQAIVPEINDQTVYLYKNGKAVRKTIQLGVRTADMVHIKSGITAGDTIITSGLLQVKDGMGIDLQLVK